MLFVTGWQQVKAEDEKARLMIPSADATSDTYTFSSSVTPLRPYFTVYLWYRNTEHTDAYWVDEPTLYLDSDKNALKLEGVYIINETKFDGSVICRKVRIDRY